MFSIVGLQNRFIKELLSQRTEEREDNVHTIPIPISEDLWRPEVSSWTVHNFILELWRNPILFISVLCVIRKVVLGKHDTEAGSLILNL